MWCSERKQGADTIANISHRGGRKLAGELGAPLFPVQAFQMVGQDDADDAVRACHRNFEWIPFGVAGDGACHCELGPCVVHTGRQDQGWAATALFAASLGIEG